MTPKYRLCLLIDDNPLDSYINSKVLEINHFVSEITIVEEPEKALALLKSEKIKPDIIFLDLRMPHMSGFEFLNEYGKLEIDKTHTKIYMLSSSINRDEINRANKNEFVIKFINKPLTRNILKELE
jgi:CheY-like chemotaxis protein